MLLEEVSKSSIVLNLNFQHELMKYFIYLKIRQRIFKPVTQEEMQTEDQVKRYLTWIVIKRMLILKRYIRASLVAQWLRVCLLMQGTRVRALVWEDPTCRGAAGPVSHNYWACASGACAPQREGPRQWKARAPRWRAVPTPRWRVAPTCRN